MSVQLEIQDGSPWYLSPNVWTVPGSDPEGAPGLPIVGQTCYMWARVQNNGTSAVNNAQVRFYWANPSVGFDRNSANLIGTSNVSLAAGEQRDVLCLVSWVPDYLNGGHLCILAEAFHPTADPLPATPEFNVPTDRHVAQRNIQVVMTMRPMMFSANFAVCNSWRTERAFTITARQGKLEELRPLLKTIGQDIPLNAKGTIKNLGFVDKPCPEEADLKQRQAEIKDFKVPGNICSGLTLTGQLEGDAALVHVVQMADGKEIGGLSVLVLKHTEQTPTNRTKKEAK